MAGRCASNYPPPACRSIRGHGEWDRSIQPRTKSLAALVFERLVALDNYGRFQPVLATEWSHDGSSKRWQFTIRPGIKFSDGTALTAADAVAALQPLLPATEQISASGNIVVIQSTTPVPDLLEQLASGRYFIYRVQANGAPRRHRTFCFERSASRWRYFAGREFTSLFSRKRGSVVRPAVCRWHRCHARSAAAAGHV